MKKGLRPVGVFHLLSGPGNTDRPDEEGIKTALAGGDAVCCETQTDLMKKGLRLGPAEQGPR